MNEMNPASFAHGPVWWSLFLAAVAFAVVGVMLLFLWQAGKEPVRRSAPAPVAEPTAPELSTPAPTVTVELAS